MPILPLNKLHGCIFWQHSWGWWLICAASATAYVLAEQVRKRSVPLQELSVEPGQAYAIIAGHEVKGVDQEVGRCSRCCIEIPQFGSKHRGWMCRSARESPLASLQSYAVLRDYLKFILLLLCFWESCRASFFLFFGHVATATFLITAKIHQSILLKIGYHI